jgi:hypothetical protein
MVNGEALEEINELSSVYEKNWGIPVDYTILPAGLCQEKLVVVLRRIVDTGESVLVGYGKIFIDSV